MHHFRAASRTFIKVVRAYERGGARVADDGFNSVFLRQDHWYNRIATKKKNTTGITVVWSLLWSVTRVHLKALGGTTYRRNRGRGRGTSMKACTAVPLRGRYHNSGLYLSGYKNSFVWPRVRFSMCSAK